MNTTEEAVVAAVAAAALSSVENDAADAEAAAAAAGTARSKHTCGSRGCMTRAGAGGTPRSGKIHLCTQHVHACVRAVQCSGVHLSMGMCTCMCEDIVAHAA